MISLDLETENEAASPTSTPKLSLYKLPTKQRQPLVMFTPPVTTSAASIPFQWEEVPGKLRPDFRPTASPAAAAVKDKNSSVARCLDLPPRLFNNKNNTCTTHNIIHPPPNKQLFPVTNYSSPTTVLDGPYPHGACGPSCSRSSAFSLPKTKGSFRSLDDEIFRDVKYQQHHHDDAIDEVTGKRNVINDKERFASWKWGSYKENNATVNDGRFSFSTGDDHHSFGCTSFASTSRGTNGGGGSSSSIAKLPRLIKRRSSFSSFSHASSNLINTTIGGHLWELQANAPLETKRRTKERLNSRLKSKVNLQQLATYWRQYSVQREGNGLCSLPFGVPKFCLTTPAISLLN